MRMWYRSAWVVAAIGLMASCGSSSTPSPSTTPSPANANTAAVSIPSSQGYGQTSFTPADVTVPVNGAVAWSNDDQIEHHPTADDGSWDVDLGPGGSGQETFKTAGSYSYHCSIHPNMTGVITVH